MIKKLVLSLLLALGFGAVAEAASPTWTPTWTGTATPTWTPTTTPTVTPTTTPTRYITNSGATWGQADWDRPALSRQGGRLMSGTLLTLGSAQGDIAGLAIPYETLATTGHSTGITFTAGELVAQVANQSRKITKTASTADQMYLGVAWTNSNWANDRMYVVTEGILNVKCSPGIFAAGDKLVAGSDGRLTPSSAISNPALYTSLSSTVIAICYTSETVTAGGDLKVRLVGPY